MLRSFRSLWITPRRSNDTTWCTATQVRHPSRHSVNAAELGQLLRGRSATTNRAQWRHALLRATASLRPISENPHRALRLLAMDASFVMVITVCVIADSYPGTARGSAESDARAQDSALGGGADIRPYKLVIINGVLEIPYVPGTGADKSIIRDQLSTLCLPRVQSNRSPRCATLLRQ